MNRLLVWLPLGVFAILVGFFFKGLSLNRMNSHPRSLGNRFRCLS